VSWVLRQLHSGQQRNLQLHQLWITLQLALGSRVSAQQALLHVVGPFLLEQGE